MDLYYQLEKHPIFGDSVREHVREFFDDLQTGLVAIANENSVRPTQIQAIKRSDSLYHDYIWPWPAMIISVNRARGPDSELPRFAEEGHEYITEYSQIYPDRRIDWQNELRDSNLIASPADFQRIRGRVSETMGAVETASLLGPGNE
jgi:hypothetical protein